NLLFCFFWGIASVVWLKGIYPKLSSLIEKIPKKAGTVGTWILLVFMTVNIGISGLAMARYSTRQAQETVIKETEQNLAVQNPAVQNPAAQETTGEKMDNRNAVEVFLDEHFPDSRMARIYPNAKMVKK
ncbi:MAG: putative ABC transporter permease, partial [Clostridium sp.]